MSIWFREFPTASAAFNTGYRALRLYVSSRSWRAWAAAGFHYLKKLRGIPAPTFVTVALTYKCQCRCDHCYAGSPVRPEEEELTTAELKSVLRQVRGLGSQSVHLSGGEPLLRKDLFELVAYSRKLGLLSRVNTNGLLINRETGRRLKAACVTECGISLDSADPAVHEQFRGTPHLYERVLSAAGILREFGIPCRIMTVALKQEVPEGLARTISLGRSLGARYMFIIPPIAVGGWDGAYDQTLNFKEREQIRELQDLTFAHVELPIETANCCVFRRAVLYVSPNGNVTPCPFVPYVLGNVRKQRLDEIWRRHTEKLGKECRGDCPMNIPVQREALRRHAASVAGELQSGRPSLVEPAS